MHTAGKSRVQCGRNHHQQPHHAADRSAVGYLLPPTESTEPASLTWFRGGSSGDKGGTRGTSTSNESESGTGDVITRHTRHFSLSHCLSSLHMFRAQYNGCIVEKLDLSGAAVAIASHGSAVTWSSKYGNDAASTVTGGEHCNCDAVCHIKCRYN